MQPIQPRGSDRPIVIVGGELAGGNAAITLREEGFDGQVVLISREPGVPFGRPPLSKTYLRSEEDLDGWYVGPPGWCDERGVERLEASVVAVDVATHTVVLDTGQEVEYQKLLIATGGRNRQLAVPGAQLPGIHQLRTVADCDAIKQVIRPNRRAVVVGMGFIGCEVTASLTQLGIQVTSIFPERTPLEKVLGEEVGAAFDAIHRAKGVELRSQEQIVGFEGSDRVEAALTANGDRVACDFAVVGIGIEPEIPPFRGEPVEQSNGVLVDGLCRTSAPDVYAAGDVANQLHPVFGRVRVEHYNNGEKQGRAAARSMLGSTDPYDYIHTFWSDQYEHKLEYVGHSTEWDQFVVRGSVDERRLIGFYLREARILAAVGLDRGGDPELDSDSEMAACVQLVGARAKPTPGQLTDERVDLWSLTR
ncbi:MAG TPA: FAD-dependent oxidoreductase [Solirubrobacteraceae bacterium]|nr:FAD-dependent oxidoreductase [Solirubrobacteraceae bacterium]